METVHGVEVGVMHFGRRDLFGALGAASPWPGALERVGLNLMNTQAMVSALDEQIARLRQTRELLLASSPAIAKRPRGRPKGSVKKTAAVPPPPGQTSSSQ